MAVDFFLPESQFADPCWEPGDCSVTEREDGRVDMYCCYSERLVAIADTVEEANGVLRVARLRGFERNLDERPDPTGVMTDMLQNLRRGVSDEDLAVDVRFPE